jgi:hypothetical protein
VIQGLLDRISEDVGGPHAQLDVTGRMDDATFMAICRFQRCQFGWADGVVDPDNKTLHRLNALAGPSPFIKPRLPLPALLQDVHKQQFPRWHGPVGLAGTNNCTDFEYFQEVLALNSGLTSPPALSRALDLAGLIPGDPPVDSDPSPWVTPQDVAALYQSLTSLAILLLGSNPPATILPDTAWYYLPERSVYVQGINPLAWVGLNRAI